MTKCPRCGDEIPGLATFCERCGEYLDDIVGGLHTPPGRELTRRTADVIPDNRKEDVIPDNRKEDVIQEAGRKALELLGFTVYSLSQDRATRQTPGIADTYVAGFGRTTWAEWKRPGENQSPDQLAFEKTVTSNGAEYHVWRHENEAIAWAKGVIEAAR